MKFISEIIITALILLLCSGAVHSEETPTADLVLVVKSVSRLYLIRDGEEFDSFKVSFGANPRGHKQQQGDERTPEGRYILDYKNSNSSFYK